MLTTQAPSKAVFAPDWLVSHLLAYTDGCPGSTPYGAKAPRIARDHWPMADGTSAYWATPGSGAE